MGKSQKQTTFSPWMKKAVTAVFLFSLCQLVWAEVLSFEKFKTHLRMNLNVKKDQLYISKKGNEVLLETLNLELFENLQKEAAPLQSNSEYFSNIQGSKDDYPNNAAVLSLGLKSSNVEIFSFYKASENKYIVDFWINDGQEKKEEAKPVVQKVAPVAPQATAKPEVVVKKVEPVQKAVEAKPVTPVVEAAPKKAVKMFSETRQSGNRDFRYGASFIWDYQPLLPSFKKLVDLSNKTPEFFYPIKDRNYKADEKESHMQLSINLYRKAKWGLMNKSISLYIKKYGKDANSYLNDYLKANALIRSNFAKKEQSVFNSAYGILSDILPQTKDYELRKALFTYLLQVNLDNGDHITALEMSKKLYIESNNNFDQEMAIVAARSVLHNLAKLNQLEKMKSFLSDKTIKKLLPGQIALAYFSYVYLKLEKLDELAALYENRKAGLIKPVHEAILYNMGELSFRLAKYEQAIKFFDDFVNEHSYYLESSYARLRIALSYDLLEKNTKELLALYRDAIDKSSVAVVRYEAKVRYVGLRIARNRSLDKDDLETLSFLDAKEDEKKQVHSSLKKLLWQVRLRSLISEKKLQQAISYLSSIPINTFLPLERRVFEADGAEIVYGLIKKLYQEEKYAETVKVWEVYKNRYVQKVAVNPYLNFLVCHSYLQLGLSESFERNYQAFIALKDQEQVSYPLWIERKEVGNVSALIGELRLLSLLKEKEWDKATAFIAQMKSDKMQLLKYEYYEGFVAFQKEDFKLTQAKFEDLLLGKIDQIELSADEVANVMTMYVESIYKQGLHDRFREVAKAFLVDLDKGQFEKKVQVEEKISYMLIESLMSSRDYEAIEVLKLTERFLKDHAQSTYASRVSYLRARALVSGKRMAEGKAILEEIVKNSQTPHYIKQLARTELLSLELGDLQL